MIPVDIRPGDVLFYTPSSLVGVLIAIKTWTWLSHVEVYHCPGRVVAAREGGVDLYPLREDRHLRYIRRPEMESGAIFNEASAFSSVKDMMGHPYEFPAFENFYNPWAVHHRVSRLCSPVVTRYLRGGGHRPFNQDVEESDISPAQLWQSPAFINLWTSKPTCRVLCLC